MLVNFYIKNAILVDYWYSLFFLSFLFLDLVFQHRVSAGSLVPNGSNDLGHGYRHVLFFCFLIGACEHHGEPCEGQVLIVCRGVERG